MEPGTDLFGRDALNEVVGRLVDDVGKLLVEQVVLRDSQLDVVLGVLRVFQTVVKTCHVGAVRRYPGVADAVVLLGRDVGSWRDWHRDWRRANHRS